MAHEFKISALGLKLIKAYEGFRPEETTLVSGQRVIGYGHKYRNGEEEIITRKKAEVLLQEDLAPYESLINENVFAPLSQSQFDALVSLAFNIGPKSFLDSNIVHAINNGRPLEAANGFDEWRKSVISGKTYVVDALVRRRTAEKALFLRSTEGVVAAPRHELPPKSDLNYERPAGAVPEFVKNDAYGIVEQAPYTAQPAQFRRRDDNSDAGILTLSELAEEEDEIQETRNIGLAAMTGASIVDTETIYETAPEVTVQRTEPKKIKNLKAVKELSPIAIAAAEVSERLDRLMPGGIKTATTERQKKAPASIKVETVKTAEVDEILWEKDEEMDTLNDLPIAANEGTHKDYRRVKSSKYTTERRKTPRSPDDYIQKTSAKVKSAIISKRYGGYWTAMIVGLTLFISGAWKWLIANGATLGKFGEFFAPVATIVGAMVVLTAFYYLMKTFFRDDTY